MRLYGLLEQLTKIILVNGKNVEILPEAQTGDSHKVLKIPAMGDTAELATQEIVLVNQAQVLKNKTIDASLNSISNIVDANVKSDAAIAGTKIDADFGAQDVTTSERFLIAKSNVGNAVEITHTGGGLPLAADTGGASRVVIDEGLRLGVNTPKNYNLSDQLEVVGTSKLSGQVKVVGADIQLDTQKGLVSSAASGILRIGHDANTDKVLVGTGDNVTLVEVGVSSSAVKVHAGSLDFTGAAPAVGLANGVTLTVGDSSTTIVTPGDLQAKDVVVKGNLTVEGDTTSIETVNLQVEDKNILVNKGGVAESGGGSGIDVEEDAAVTGYVKVALNRNGWQLKAPNSANVVTIPNSTAGGDVALLEGTQTFSGDKTFSADITMSGTGSLKLPVGSDGQRPVGVQGMVRYNSDQSSFEGFDGTTWSGLGGGGTTDRITQATHGFVVGDVLWFDPGTPPSVPAFYAKASADAANTAEVVGVVSKVIDENTFELTLSGEVEGLSGLTSGSVYFLSASVEGGITEVEPSVVGQVSLPVGVASSASSLYVAPKRGVVVGAANLRTQIGLSENASTNIQKVTGYDAGELAGWVDLNATADYKFYVQAQFVKNAAGAWNISYQTTGDTPPAGFNMDIVTSGADAFIQVSLPAMAGYVNGKINFALNAPAVGATLPLQIDGSNVNGPVLGSTSGAAPAAGYVGETVVGSTVTTATPVFNNKSTIATFTIPAGIWDLSIFFTAANTTAASPAKFTASIIKSSGNGTVYSKGTFQSPSPGVSTATTPGNTEVNASAVVYSDGTLVIGVSCGHYANSTTGTLSVGGSIVTWTRVRIA